MFQFPSFASQSYEFRLRYPALIGMGCPIQKSPDLNLFSGSPKLIAAYHVFHRLLVPRHPPYALSSLTVNHKPQKSKLLDQIQLSKIIQH